MPSKECITDLVFCKVAIAVPGLQLEKLKSGRLSDVLESLGGADPGFKTKLDWLQSRGVMPLLYGLVLPWRSPTDILIRAPGFRQL